MPATLATASAILKEIYEPGLRKQLESRKVLLNRIEKSSDGVETNVVGGKYVTFPLHVKRNSGIGARNEMEDLPIAGNQGTVAARIGLKYLYGSIQLTGQTMKLVNEKYQSFVKALELETNGIKDDLLKDTNRQYYGNGSGAIATTDSTGAVNAMHITAGFQYIQDDMIVDIWTSANLAANTTPKAVSRKVTAINEGTQTITFDGAAATLTAGDVITRAGSANREVTGLAAIVSDTGVLYNVDPTTVRQWKATVDANGGTPRPLTESMLIKNVDAVGVKGSEVSVMLTSMGVRRAYFNLLTQQRKFVNEKTFTGGFKGLAFTTDAGEVPLIADSDCPNGTVYGLTEKHLKTYRESAWSFMNEDGNMWYRVPGSTAGTMKDAYGATLFQYTELGTDRRNAHFKILDITEA